jgi:hypothetical protein
MESPCKQIRCLVPAFDGAYFSGQEKEARWDRYCTGAPLRPECYMASTEIRNRRRTLRYRNLVLKQMTQMKNRISGHKPPIALPFLARIDGRTW